MGNKDMNYNEICSNLCYKDNRFPDYEDLILDNLCEGEPLPEPRTNCFCDNVSMAVIN